jgi:hypothetical protein
VCVCVCVRLLESAHACAHDRVGWCGVRYRQSTLKAVTATPVSEKQEATSAIAAGLLAITQRRQFVGRDDSDDEEFSDDEWE